MSKLAVLLLLGFLSHFCGMELQAIADFCLFPLAGVQTIEYIPTIWVDQDQYEPVVSSSWNWQYQLPLLPDRSWLKCPFIPRPRWDESPSRSSSGTSYTQSLSMRLPKMEPSVSGILDAMDEHQFIIRLRDRADNMWKIGSLEHPIEFNAIANSGGQGQFGGYLITWSGETSQRAVGFAPAF